MGFADGKNMRRLSRVCLLFLMAAIPVSAAGSDAARGRVQTQGRIVMGTVLRITLTEPRPGKSEAIFERAFREARNLDLMLSHYRTDSVLSQLNALAGQRSAEVPDELYRVLQMSARFSRLTEGAFDVTLGPLFRAWERAGRSGRLPQDLTRTLRRVGWRHLEFQDKNRVGLRRRGMRLNLGAVGKGFAVDKVIDVLRRSGVCCALVDFGGSAFFALGAPDGDRAWNLWVPGIDAQSPIGVVSLRDQALSVSSAFGNKFVIQGRVYGHILDPRTGRPLTRPAVAAVIARAGRKPMPSRPHCWFSGPIVDLRFLSGSRASAPCMTRRRSPGSPVRSPYRRGPPPLGARQRRTTRDDGHRPMSDRNLESS